MDRLQELHKSANLQNSIKAVNLDQSTDKVADHNKTRRLKRQGLSRETSAEQSKELSIHGIDKLQSLSCIANSNNNNANNFKDNSSVNNNNNNYENISADNSMIKECVNNGSDGDDQEINAIQECFQETESKVLELSTLISSSTVLINKSNNNNNNNTTNVNNVESAFNGVQEAIDRCTALLQNYDNRTSQLKEEDQQSKSKVLSIKMRERVGAHLHRKLNTLCQQLWNAEDEWQRKRIETVARQLWLRFRTSTWNQSTSPAAVNVVSNSLSNSSKQTESANGAFNEPDYSPPRGADTFNKDDITLLAEALVYAEHDDRVFDMSVYELREAVERYNAVCNIKDKMRRLHHLCNELNWQVNEQDDALHDIAQQANITQVKVFHAREQLQRAKKYHSRCGCGCCCSAM